MKKIIFLFPLLFILILSGCADNKKTNYYGNETSETKTPASTETTNSMPIPSEINQDLAKQYSGAVLVTSLGRIEVAFYNESPITVSNFLTLAQKGFYDGTLFHRVIKSFMIQGGDPNSKLADRSTHGMGGPSYEFADEFNDHKLVKGSLAMANSGPNTNGSQFFIVTAPATDWLDGKHTNFGYVTKGMDVVDKIEAVKVDGNDHPIDDVKIESVELVK